MRPTTHLPCLSDVSLVPGCACVLTIRRSNNSIELAVIQPVQSTVLAIVNDDVAASTIWMRLHLPAALRAVDPAIQIFPVDRVRASGGSIAARAHILNDRHEHAHGDQRAVAVITVENPFPAGGCVDERNCTYRAGHFGRLVEHAYTLGIRLGIVYVAAIIADQTLFVCFQTHCGAAG